jgi:hypothetical protein
MAGGTQFRPGQTQRKNLLRDTTRIPRGERRDVSSVADDFRHRLVREAYHVRHVEYTWTCSLPSPPSPRMAVMCGTYVWEIYSSPNTHYETSSPTASPFPGVSFCRVVNKIESTSSAVVQRRRKGIGWESAENRREKIGSSRRSWE